jgi:hypothetical protein
VASNFFAGAYNFAWQIPPNALPEPSFTAAREIVTTTPPGYSFSSPKISATGDVTANGNTVFADGFSSTPRPATVSKNGEWPFFATSSPEPSGVNDFRSLGFGWLRVDRNAEPSPELTVASNSEPAPTRASRSASPTISGDVTWVMAPNTRHYSNGFTSTNPVLGSAIGYKTASADPATLTLATFDAADPLLEFPRTFPARFVGSTFNVTAPNSIFRPNYNASNGRLTGLFNYSTPASVDYFTLKFQAVYLPFYDTVVGSFKNQNGVGLFQADVPDNRR